MDELWNGVVKYCGITAVAGFVGYTVYPLIIASPYLKNLTHTELFTLLGLCCVIQAKDDLPLTPGGLTPRAPSRACPVA